MMCGSWVPKSLLEAAAWLSQERCGTFTPNDLLKMAASGELRLVAKIPGWVLPGEGELNWHDNMCALTRASAAHSRSVLSDSTPPKGINPPIGFVPSFSVVPLHCRRRFTKAHLASADQALRVVASLKSAYMSDAKPQTKTAFCLGSRIDTGGACRSRTDLHGFAIRCITALLTRRDEVVFLNR